MNEKDGKRLSLTVPTTTTTITNDTSGQSYKGSTIVNYDSRVVIWGNFKSGMTLEL